MQRGTSMSGLCVSYIKVSEALEVILFELSDTVVLQVQKLGVQRNILWHLSQTWGEDQQKQSYLIKCFRG